MVPFPEIFWNRELLCFLLNKSLHVILECHADAIDYLGKSICITLKILSF